MMIDNFEWYGMDVSLSYNAVVDFFAQWGYETCSQTVQYRDVKNPYDLVDSLDMLQASSVEDLPERVVIALNDYGGSGEMLVLKPGR